MTPTTTAVTEPPRTHHAANIASIATLFAIWKTLLLAIVAASPGPGYDTSTVLMLADPRAGVPTSSTTLVSRAVEHLLTRLVRWDSVYFVNIAQRGYVFEQEWAFGRGFHAMMAWVAEWLGDGSSSFLAPVNTRSIADQI